MKGYYEDYRMKRLTPKRSGVKGVVVIVVVVSFKILYVRELAFSLVFYIYRQKGVQLMDKTQTTDFLFSQILK